MDITKSSQINYRNYKPKPKTEAEVRKRELLEQHLEPRDFLDQTIIINVNKLEWTLTLQSK